METFIGFVFFTVVAFLFGKMLGRQDGESQVKPVQLTLRERDTDKEMLKELEIFRSILNDGDDAVFYFQYKLDKERTNAYKVKDSTKDVIEKISSLKSSLNQLKRSIESLDGDVDYADLIAF